MSQNVVTPSNFFDKFPDEIIEIIAEYLKSGHHLQWRRDICRFAFCNRRLRRIALPVLYRSVRLNPAFEFYYFYQFLLDFPQYASLVKTISLTGPFQSLCGRWRPLNELEYADTSRIIRDMRNRSLPQEIIEEVERKKVEWALALCLLTLLPNLEGFELYPGGVRRYNFNACSALMFSPRYLNPSLRSVSLTDTLVDYPASVDILVPLFSFPSITEISTQRLESDSHTIDDSILPPSAFANPNTDHTSTVETLHFYDCELSERDLKMLLRLPKSLKSFSYVHQRGSRSRLSPVQVRKALDHVSGTLNTLIIKFDDSLLESVQALSFADFPALKTLTINYKLLYGPNLEDIVDRLPPYLEALDLHLPHDPLPEDRTAAESITTFLSKRFGGASGELQ